MNGWKTARLCCVATIVGLVVIPPSLLLVQAGTTEPAQSVWTPAFFRAVWQSIKLAGGVTLWSLAVGGVVGVSVALYTGRGARLLLILQVLPLLLPSFLPSIGWSNWQVWLHERLPGPSGLFQVPPLVASVWVLGWQYTALPLLTAWTACRSLRASQIESARLAGGERLVLKLTARTCFVPTLLAAVLAGVLSLSDVGAPLIFGLRTAAVEIRTSFSALFDYSLAARQSLVLALLVLALVSPAVMLGVPQLASAVLAKQTQPLTPTHHKWWSRLSGGLLTLVLAAAVVIPAAGLALPVVEHPMFGRAWAEIAQALPSTVVFAGSAAAVAVGLGLLLSLCAARNRRVQTIAVGVLVVVFALPPATGALGVARLAAASPAAFDWLLRSQATVGWVTGLHVLPVAAVLLLRAVRSVSESWLEAARLHGLHSRQVLFKIVLPFLWPAVLVSGLLTAVLALADIVTTLLLAPPGKQSVPVAIFTVMANSPEGLVGSLCLLYVAAVAGLLTAGTAAVWLFGKTSQQPGVSNG